MAQTQITEPAIREFLEKLMQEKRVVVSDPELKEEMLQDLNARLQAKLFATILANLQGEAFKQFEALINEKQPDQTEIQKFLQDNVKDAAEVMAKAMLEFREAYLKP